MFVQPGFEGGRGFPGGIFPSRGEVVTRAVPNEHEIFSTHFKIRKNLYTTQFHSKPFNFRVL